ncbi:hypothetical protein NUW58_g5809 [Xylaria curta]|uniref:Uncharacterized protein n=1 Tax=Xylaria curta TaxID=42375 RepID=A0ACC1P0C6_9PEZI|nr:hypothetical protein NUW58_g5809 [Xylaria curta]
MASTVEKVTQVADQAVNDVTNALSNTSLTENKDENKDAVHASAAEGRRLYIGNLAYATTEGELKEFFKGYLVVTSRTLRSKHRALQITPFV